MTRRTWGLGQSRVLVKSSSWLTLGVVLSCASAAIEPRGSGGAADLTAGSTNAGAEALPVEMSGAGEPAMEPTPSPELGWCDAQPILSEKCGRCHGTPLDNGAPFALTTYEDVHLSDSRGTPRYERMLSAIETELMPATFIKLTPPVEPLTAAERAVLLEWLGAEAPRGAPEPCRDPQ